MKVADFLHSEALTAEQLEHALLQGQGKQREAALRQLLGADRRLSSWLQQGLRYGSVALLESLQVLLLSDERSGSRLSCRVGLSYDSVIAGCQCADDPDPDNTAALLCAEYMELEIVLELGTNLEAKSGAESQTAHEAALMIHIVNDSE